MLFAAILAMGGVVSKNINKSLELRLGKKYRIQGDPYKNLSKCPESCLGVGAFYNPNGIVAGLKLNPATPSDASINGFKTDKVT